MPDLDMVVLEYESLEHVRMGIYDSGIDTKEKSFVEFEGKKYLLAELTGQNILLGDPVLIGSRQPSHIFR
jgi:hypothetical protein